MTGRLVRVDDGSALVVLPADGVGLLGAVLGRWHAQARRDGAAGLPGWALELQGELEANRDTPCGGAVAAGSVEAVLAGGSVAVMSTSRAGELLGVGLRRVQKLVREPGRLVSAGRGLVTVASVDVELGRRS